MKAFVERWDMVRGSPAVVTVKVQLGDGDDIKLLNDRKYINKIKKQQWKK